MIADGIKEGIAIHRGQVLGYVGTSGNAPKRHTSPALRHLPPDRGKALVGRHPIDPFDILR